MSLAHHGEEQMNPGFYEIKLDKTLTGYLWMQAGATSSELIAYYVLVSGTSFPINLDGKSLVFKASTSFSSVTNLTEFWYAAAALLGQTPSEVVRACQEETTVPWPS